MRETAPAEMPGIAIIGMSGCFPGSVDIEAFWGHLRDGVECIARFTVEELRQSGISESLLRDPSYVRAKGFLCDADCFDAVRFGMSAREAAQTDPQHRIFLECCLTALDDARCAPQDSAAVGVFAGCGASQYGSLASSQSGTAERPAADLQNLLAVDRDFLATRVSYKLNLRGPSLTVQTACSTSLVAVCLACQNLLTYQCDVALAGGVSISLPLRAGYLYEPEMIFSPDGHCRPFDASAQGTVPGDGAGVVVLKRLADALRDGDSVLAVIRGFGLNNDGSAKMGFTAPSRDGQAAAIAQALALAAFSARTVGYVEAHGTATPLGDPIEVAALTAAFLDGGARLGSCALGSVKSNIGHLNAAAGVAGLIKVVQVLRHGEIPATLHYQRANPQIDFASTPFFVNTSLRRWDSAGPRRAGVSSFGVGGTNAHLLLEEAPPHRPVRPRGSRQSSALTRRRFWIPSSEGSPAPALREPSSWFYRPRWQPVAWPASPLEPEGEYLLLADDGELAEAVCAALSPAHVTVIRPGDHFARGAGGYTLRLSQPADYAAVVAELAAVHRLPATILHLWSVTAAPHDSAAALERSFLSALRLIRALGSAADQRPLRMLTVTRGGQPVGESQVTRPEHAAALALQRVLPAEYPQLRCRVVDVAETDRDSSLLARRLLAELAIMRSSALCAVAHRGEQRFEQRFEQVRVASAGDAPLRRRGAYLITGGLGGIGGTLARHFARAAQARLVLLGRRGLPPRADWPAILDTAAPEAEAVRAVLEMEDGGAEVLVLAADVACKTELASALAQARARFGPLLGVVHAAGLTSGGIVQVQPEEALLATLAPKFRGALLLDELLREEPLDFFVLCSSLTALAGGVGQAGYCAANCFLDAFAHTLRERGVRALAINWDGWQEVGAAAREAKRRQRPDLAEYLKPQEGIEVFARALHTGWPQVIVSARDLTSRLSDRLRESAEAQGRDKAAAADLAQGTPLAVEQTLAAIWQAALGVKQVQPADDFFQLGGDSLLAIDVLSSIREKLGVELGPHFLLEAPTFAQLLARVRSRAEAPPRSSSPQTLVRLRNGNGARPPLFLLHPVGGQVYFYRDLAAALAADQEVFGIQARPLPPDVSATSIRELATAYLRDLRCVQPAGPYLLAGSSFGGLLAYEIACQLSDAREAIGLVAMVDAPGPGYLPQTLCDDAEILGYLLCRGLPSPAALAELRGLSTAALIQHYLRHSAHRPSPVQAASVEEVLTLLRLWRANYRALLDHAPRPWPLAIEGRLLFFTPTEADGINALHAERAWLPLVPQGLEVHPVPGSHITMNFSPNVDAIATVIQAAIAQSLADFQDRRNHAVLRTDEAGEGLSR